MLVQSPQNETADIGFLRNIGLAFIVLTVMTGSITIGLVLKQSDNSAPVTIASNLAQPVVAELAK
jgi:hypothetical protein